MCYKDKLERRYKRLETYFKGRKITKLQSEYEWRTILPPEIGTTEKSRGEKKVMKMETHVKAILSTFCMGTCRFDVGYFALLF